MMMLTWFPGETRPQYVNGLEILQNTIQEAEDFMLGVCLFLIACSKFQSFGYF